MAQSIAETARGQMEYRLEGAGPTVMVLNGGHCSRDSRLSHEQLAAHGFSVLTPSRPGYDGTPSGVGRKAHEAADALAALLDTLHISTVDVIGISAAGPTALVFAQRHPDRIRKLILESAVTTPWDERTKRGARILFGRAERVTWALTRLALTLIPRLVIRAIMRQLTTLEMNAVMRHMSEDDLAFVRKMIRASRSGSGFMNDIEHRVDDLTGIAAPVLVMYSCYDRAVPPINATRVAAEVATCELREVPAETHLLWIGKHKKQVSESRLAFLTS